jgi:hypothetical protein
MLPVPKNEDRVQPPDVDWKRIKDALGRLRASEQEMEFGRIWYFLCTSKKKMDLYKKLDDDEFSTTMKELQETIEFHAIAMDQLTYFRSQLIFYPHVKAPSVDSTDYVCHIVAHDITIVQHVLKLVNRKYSVDSETGVVRRRHFQNASVNPFPTVYNVQILQQRLMLIEEMRKKYVEFISSQSNKCQ